MSAPIFRDPRFDGATDPSLIRRSGTSQWWMFYTQRRPSADGPGVSWVHGTQIGVAISCDFGATWKFAGTAKGLDTGFNTLWAPEVVHAHGEYRMYLTVVDGVPDRWDGVERHIVEYRSSDLVNWRNPRRIPLSSHQVIDACIALCPDGKYRLWYKDEAHESTTWVAASEDLADWTVEGMAIGGPAHEGPNVFELAGWWWMTVDEWCGLAVYRSIDAVTWTRQTSDRGMILQCPGRNELDTGVGRHADVVVDEFDKGRALIYYFTHPHESVPRGADRARRSAIHVAKLRVTDGILECDRDVAPSQRLP